MNRTTNEPQNEFRKLRRDIRKGLRNMLDFNTCLLGFDRRTLALFITLTSDHSTFGETLKQLEELERELS